MSILLTVRRTSYVVLSPKLRMVKNIGKRVHVGRFGAGREEGVTLCSAAGCFNL